MGGRGSSLWRSLLLLAVGAMLSGGIAAAVTSTDDQIQQTSVSEGTPILGIRPTGVGLPLVGAHGTVGAGDYAGALKSYHDSGHYLEDADRVDARAESYLIGRLRQLREAKGQPGSTGLSKPAMVLDIDETSLSHYDYLAATNFTNPTVQLAIAVAAANSPALAPTLDLYRLAKSRGVAVFFITGRPGGVPGARSQTEANLIRAGYANWDGLIMNPDVGGPAIPYKSAERAKIEANGYRILVNVGDQESDLAGGHAERGFKLPNPFYFIE